MKMEKEQNDYKKVQNCKITIYSGEGLYLYKQKELSNFISLDHLFSNNHHKKWKEVIDTYLNQLNRNEITIMMHIYELINFLAYNYNVIKFIRVEKSGYEEVFDSDSLECALRGSWEIR